MKYFFRNLTALLLTVMLVINLGACAKSDLYEDLLEEDNITAAADSNNAVDSSDAADNAGAVPTEAVISPDMEAGTYDPDDLYVYYTLEDGSIAIGKTLGCYVYKIDQPDANAMTEEYMLDFDTALLDDYNCYCLTLKQGLCFNDGTPIEASDLLASYYDELNVSDSPLRTLDIYGQDEYLTGISAATVDMLDTILEAGINEDGSYPELEGITAEQQASVWQYLDAAGLELADSIIEYVKANYNDDKYVFAFMSSSLTYAELEANPSMMTAYAMTLWGYGREKNHYDYVNNVFTDCYMNSYDLDEAELGAEQFWQLIKLYHGYDMSDTGINYEYPDDSDMTIQARIREMFLADHQSYATEVSGIALRLATDSNGVTRDCVCLLLSKDSDVADFNFKITEH